MTLKPTGRIDCSSAIPELVFDRLLPVSHEVAWAALTESERTARWIGSWNGEAKPGNTIEIVWMAEEGSPTDSIRIMSCDPPHRLALAGGPDPTAAWLVSVQLLDAEGGTRLEFRQQMNNGLSPALVGTGWEFYLDRYVAALVGDEAAAFEAYQTLQPHYEELQAAMTLCTED